METLRALIRGDLAPAGFPINQTASLAPSHLFADTYQTHWLDSGTSALALALMDCKLRQADVESPQVIIPGYCCPDLVAAAVYAGVEPLVVDIEENDPAYNLDQLASALNPRVIAVIAINFLGIRERLTDIRNILKQYSKPIYLIEDNAQWFPDNPHTVFESDYVAFSFGRGKPLSLLGGGALLTKVQLSVDVALEKGADFGFKQKLKITAYNLLLHPHWYAFINRAPFLRLGETRYHPLDKITTAPEAVYKLFAENYQAYQQRSLKPETFYQQHLGEKQKLQPLESERKQRLLRYPLVLESAKGCSELYRQLSADGLGASRMYQDSLNAIQGVDGKIQCFSNLANAKSFASRLMTLPVHAYVRESHLHTIINRVNSI